MFDTAGGRFIAESKAASGGPVGNPAGLSMGQCAAEWGPVARTPRTRAI